MDNTSKPALKIAVCVGGGVTALFALYKLVDYLKVLEEQRRLEREMDKWPLDVVILHGMRRGKVTPNPSPFVMKLETFLRMHKIPYYFDCQFPKGEKDKMPWITINREHYNDSQLIIKILSVKYGIKDSNPDVDRSLAGGSTLARVTMDEHFYWGLILWRYVYSNGVDFDHIFNMKPFELKKFQRRCYYKYKYYTWCQGTGRHTEDEATQIMMQDLRALSAFLGSKQFLRGDKPCNDDCAVFGMLSQLIWNDISSPYTALIEEELPNLKAYCTRMKDRYWHDWNQVIIAASELYRTLDLV